MTRPIKELAHGVAELKDGLRVKPLRIYSSDELGRLTTSFNEMATLITDQQDQLGKYAHDLEEAYVSTVRVLAAAIDARDPTPTAIDQSSTPGSEDWGALGLAKRSLKISGGASSFFMI